jgi:hypothetical protein
MRREESRRTRCRGLGGTLPELTNLFAMCMPAFPGLLGRRLHSPLIQKFFLAEAPNHTRQKALIRLNFSPNRRRIRVKYS